MFKIFTPVLVIFMCINLGFAQTYDIKFPQQDRAQKCQQFEQIFQNKPREVKFSIERDGANLFLVVNDRTWFHTLFKNSGDGVAIDIVSKDLFPCDQDLRLKQIRGFLIPPVYMAKLKTGLKPVTKERFKVRVGEIPEGLLNDELEFNILFLSNKNLCTYFRTYHLESYPWELLDMGMYLDSLQYTSKRILSTDKEKFVMKYKAMQFTIPFEKNKSNYQPADIKPMVDSLRLTDFTIKNIYIRAYSSVEGSTERNAELQQKRANSIVEALQTFQKPTINTEVYAAENWVDFMNDVSSTQYDYYVDLKKDQIKSKLVGAELQTLEPFLATHRKAVITFELERKDKYKSLETNQLIGMFNTATKDDKLTDAIEIQNSIFEKLKESQGSPEELKKMTIPNQVKYLTLLTKQSVYKYLLNESYLLIAFNELKQLEKLSPKDPKIKYNLVALEFVIWKYRAQPVKETVLKTKIQQLKNYGIQQLLTDRMMVNYHIVKSELFMRAKDYSNKDKSVNYILAHYKKFPLSDFDYLSLAQFLTYYSNKDKAETLLSERARSVEISEDLLFYYLNLTLIDKELTQSSAYRTIMLNAINMNKERYCKIFNSIAKEGVSFQLLEDDFLRSTYCENCTN